MRLSRIRIFYVFQLEKEKTGEGKHLLEKRVPFPCSVSTARPIPSSPKPPNIIEYLLAVSGKMKNHRKAIALEPLWQLHKKSSRNIPGTFFHNRNSCRITSPPANILRVGVRGRELFEKSSLPRFVFLLQQAFGNVNDMIDGEPEVLEQHVAGGGLAKAGHADHRAVEPHVLPPTVHGGSFDRHARTHGAG